MNWKNQLYHKKSWMKYLVLVLALFLVSCNQNESNADAYGNFEAQETLVSAESNGKILMLNIEEGESVKKNQEIALIDTILPALQMLEIEAQRGRIIANMNNIDAQKNVLKQQKENLQIEVDRITKLKESGASTQKQFDDITGQLKVLEEQLTAYDVQKTAISKEMNVLASKKQLLLEQINKCKVVNPKSGTVLEKYSEQGEITAAGKPLYKIADLENINLKAYVSGGQLHEVKVGNTCKVLIDTGNKEYLEFEEKITWISNQAEFTPKIIQTKEERVNMVYAIKILVKNDGSIKLGMPGEVIF